MQQCLFRLPGGIVNRFFGEVVLFPLKLKKNMTSCSSSLVPPSKQNCIIYKTLMNRKIKQSKGILKGNKITLPNQKLHHCDKHLIVSQKSL